MTGKREGTWKDLRAVVKPTEVQVGDAKRTLVLQRMPRRRWKMIMTPSKKVWSSGESKSFGEEEGRGFDFYIYFFQ